jgi:hypothetical protein
LAEVVSSFHTQLFAFDIFVYNRVF